MASTQSSVEKPGAKKLDLLDDIWTKIKPEQKEDQIIASLMSLAHSVLGASAASLLQLDEKKQDLYFKFAEGPLGHKLKRLHVARQSGVAGWIMQHGKPLVINNPQKTAQFYKLIDEATGFKTKSIIAVPLTVNNKLSGVIEVLNKVDGSDFTQRDLKILMGVAATAATAIECTKMNANLLDSYRGTVKALVALADSKETSGGGHSRRVAEYALMGAAELGLSKDAKLNIEYAAILHDIGKLSISDTLLNKSKDLSDDEWKLIKKHPVTSYNMLRDIPVLKEASKLILHHHERYDGGGYPQGLCAESIPLGARLIAVADAFDNMTTDHNYRQALDHKQAFDELSRNIRTQFCPVAVKAFSAGFVSNRLRQTSDENAPRLIDF